MKLLKPLSPIEKAVGQFRYMVREGERCHLVAKENAGKHSFAQCLYRRRQCGNCYARTSAKSPTAKMVQR